MIKAESLSLMTQVYVVAICGAATKQLFLCYLLTYDISQIQLATISICQTCEEFSRDLLNFRVEGHTAFSKKSKDGGKKTSGG